MGLLQLLSFMLVKIVVLENAFSFLTRHMLERYTSLVDTCTSLEKEEIVDLERTRTLNSTVAHKNCSC